VSVGQALAEARAQRGLSVEDVSASTRIRAGLIRDIESDHFESCGGDVYARGHIRSISHSLGIDAAPLIEEFAATHGNVEAPVLAPTPAETDRVALAHTERRRPNWAAAMVVALLVVIGVAAYGALSGGGGKQNAHNAATSRQSLPAGQHSTPPVTTTKHKQVHPPSSSVAQSSDPTKAVLQVRATNATTWLQITNASTGALLFRGNLEPGQHKRYVEPFPLSFIIGNAPAVDMVVNGKDIGSPKSSGNVARGKIAVGSRQVQPA
jgi:cytoskeleton protein RodZ